MVGAGDCVEGQSDEVAGLSGENGGLLRLYEDLMRVLAGSGFGTRDNGKFKYSVKRPFTIFLITLSLLGFPHQSFQNISVPNPFPLAPHSSFKRDSQSRTSAFSTRHLLG